MNPNLITVLIIAAVIGAALWFAWSCLADLVRTTDDQLQRFPRMAWAILIVVTIPIGGFLYLTYGKRPRRHV